MYEELCAALGGGAGGRRAVASYSAAAGRRLANAVLPLAALAWFPVLAPPCAVCMRPAVWRSSVGVAVLLYSSRQFSVLHSRSSWWQ